jgi:thioredoxin-related protein
MDDEAITTFCSITGTTPQQAQQYLQFSDGNVETAIELFFNNPDLAASAAAPSAQPTSSRDAPINLDDDDDEGMDASGPSGGQSTEDDEAMARRLQQEMYGAGGGGGGAGLGDVDEEGVRAPMARTTETLVGPNSDWRDDPNEMQAAIGEQMEARMRHRQTQRAGIFNQRSEASIWSEDNPADPEAHRRALSRATGGASDATSKSTLLADLFRPPFDLISNLPISAARDEGKENEKWILVNVQDPSIFDCQVLNRDIWKNDSIKDTVKEHFIFLQYSKDDPRGQEYVNYYFSAHRDNEDSYPHIAIVDPRTGEQVKTWSGSPGPKPSDFLMDLHEFLDRYSLNMQSKNPVQTQRKERKKDVGQMSEEEMLEMAMQNSLANGGSKDRDEDPDALTKSTEGKGKEPASLAEAMDTADMGPVATNGTTEPAASNDTPFSRISSTTPHEEPTSTDPKETTRIQFRYSGGRIVRRFSLNDPVSRIYEWLKAAPFEGKENTNFELISMGKNLIEMLDVPIADASLKNGTVMVEFIDDE